MIIKNSFSDLKKLWKSGAVLVVCLWMMLWGTYNTEIFTLFKGSVFFLHRIRSLLPFFAFFISVAVIFKKRKNLTVGFALMLFLLYSLIGLAASTISKNFIISFYWGFLYLCVITTIIATNNIYGKNQGNKIIIWVNFLIAGGISLLLTIIFFSQPNILSSETVSQFLKGFRPYEGIGGVAPETDFLGMVGTRPTGIGRYAGLAAIMMFACLWAGNGKKIKIACMGLFSLFSLILVFSRARTSVIAFLMALFVMSLFFSKEKLKFLFILSSVLLLLFPTNLYNYAKNYFLPGTSGIIEEVKLEKNENLENLGFPDERISTLSGRTFIWSRVMNMVKASPFIGMGFHADRIFLNGLHAHNTWIHSLFQAGIAGFLFFASGFIISVFLILNRIKHRSIVLLQCLGILVFFGVRSFAESFAFFGADFLFIIPAIAFIGNYKIDRQKQINILGKKIDIVRMEDVFKKIEFWIKNNGKNCWIVLCGMHGVAEGYKDKIFKEIINQADLSLPDGMSLVFFSRAAGFQVEKRIAGPDLMKGWLEYSSLGGNYKNFFLGDTNEVLRNLVKKTVALYPGVNICGTYSPPFTNFTNEENEKTIRIIKEKRPDVLWVSFSLKKQEKWIYEHRSELNVPVIIGVGAAFKFLSGKVKRAPNWVGNIGFEWLWRFLHEPKRLWKRVVIDIPIFAWMVLKDLFK